MPLLKILLSILPIALLIYLMSKKNNWASHHALPFATLILYLLKIFYFQENPTLTHASVIQGLLTAFTPILVIAGAIFLFKTLQISGAMRTIKTWLSQITQNKVAQIMIIAWAFGFLIEGASGFGTPVALAAPILVGLGFPAIRVLMTCLVMNSVPVSFGAVGTPTWFGLGNLGLTSQELIQIGVQTSIIHFTASFLIPFLALKFLLTKKEILQNWKFIILSILSCVLPYILLAFWSYEFSSLVGGFLGTLLTIFLAKKHIGLKTNNSESLPKNKLPAPKHSLRVAKALAPIILVIIILVVTRVEALGIKQLLNSTQNSRVIPLGTLGSFLVSPSLALQLKNILGSSLSWNHALLYVPSIIPFVLISIVSFPILKVKKNEQKLIFTQTFQQIQKPAIALFAALIFVKLLLIGEHAPAIILGQSLANLAGKSWIFISPALGALGAFFSGSNTVSNLVFGGIQKTAAIKLNLNIITILSLQNTGGAMGNMICINNIIAGASVLGLQKIEGQVLRRTIIPMIFYVIIAGVLGVIFQIYFSI